MKQLDVVAGGVPQELLQDLISVRSKMKKRKRLVQLGNYLHYTCMYKGVGDSISYKHCVTACVYREKCK